MSQEFNSFVKKLKVGFSWFWLSGKDDDYWNDLMKSGFCIEIDRGENKLKEWIRSGFKDSMYDKSMIWIIWWLVVQPNDLCTQ